MSGPTAKGENGRMPNGKFAKGWRGGPGNPHAAQVAKLRSALLAAISEADLKSVIAALLQKAQAGDVAAAKEILDRCLGRAPQAIEIDAQVEGRYEDVSAVAALRRELLHQPEYLDFVRSRLPGDAPQT